MLVAERPVVAQRLRQFSGGLTSGSILLSLAQVRFCSGFAKGPSHGTSHSLTIFALFLLIGMLLMLEIGRRIGVRRRPKESEESGAALARSGAVFAYLA
jgi:hypothetical protein